MNSTEPLTFDVPKNTDYTPIIFALLLAEYINGG